MKNKSFNASAYRTKTIGDSQTYDVEMPSGFTFTLRRPNVEVMAAGGFLPQTLLSKLIAAEDGETEATIAQTKATTEEATKILDFLGKIVKQACVRPRIVDKPQSDSEIGFADLSDADYHFILAWTRRVGGVEGENLEKFRQSA